jgi:hypothetical protein
MGLAGATLSLIERLIKQNQCQISREWFLLQKLTVVLTDEH